MSDPTLWATTEDADVAAPARTFIRWLLTVGAAILYAVLVSKVCADVWNGSATVDSVYAGVMNSLGLTFGSAFVGWFGVTTTQANVTVAVTDNAWKRRWEIFGQLMTDLAGAAVFAMVIYLVAGALAGITFLFNEKETPTVLITVATAWAAQATAVVAATLAAVLKAP